jgi:triosephosphate isomerase (TIM)
MSRLPLIAANWKMNKTQAEAQATAQAFKQRFGAVSGREVAVCPPATALYLVGQEIKETGLALGAQDIFWEEKGAFTGLISPLMLTDLGCKYVIIGHSERRGRFGKADPNLTPGLASVFSDNDATVNRKALAALQHGLSPIICCGETLPEREAGQADSVIAGQVEKALLNLPADRAEEIVFAYEPVWAIGTGKVCETDEANRIIGLIRQVIGKVLGSAAADKVRILYGGSVAPNNAEQILAQAEIDGVLVGGASLEAEKFAPIVFAGAKSG